MKKSHISTHFSIALASISLISACTTENPNGSSSSATQMQVTEPVKPQPTVESPEQIAEKAARATAQTALDSGIALYNNGDYRDAIKRFGSVYESLKPYKEMELQALKFTAFSYCVTGRTALCRLQFERAIKLDRSFDLEPGEKGHPLWGPVFERVKKKEGN
jgi:hypothetical protein